MENVIETCNSMGLINSFTGKFPFYYPLTLSTDTAGKSAKLILWKDSHCQHNDICTHWVQDQGLSTSISDKHLKNIKLKIIGCYTNWQIPRIWGKLVKVYGEEGWSVSTVQVFPDGQWRSRVSTTKKMMDSSCAFNPVATTILEGQSTLIAKWCCKIRLIKTIKEIYKGEKLMD